MRLILPLTLVLFLSSCDRSSNATKSRRGFVEIELSRESGRAAAEGTNKQVNELMEPFEKQSKKVTDFSQGFMEFHVEKSVERSNKRFDDLMKKMEADRRSRDKGFPGHNPNAGFPGHDRQK